MISRDELIAEATRIGDLVLSRAESAEPGLCWETNMPAPGGFYRAKSATLYSGSAGIALFLLNLAEATQQAKYWDAARAALQWTEATLRRERPPVSGFYSGAAGSAWALLHAGTRLGIDNTGAALDIARRSPEALRCHTADLLAGVAGTILALLHIHAATGEAWLLEDAAQLVDELIDRARKATTGGLYWDRNPENIRGLCGLSHGASGIGWVMAELSRYTGNDAFAWMARQAFGYERSHFDALRCNWPDFRKSAAEPGERERLQNEYLRGNLRAFYEPGDMNAWCHGAAGIGLARLRASELLGDAELSEEAQLARQRVRSDFLGRDGLSACLCHGSLGNAAFLYATSDDDQLVGDVLARCIAAARSRGAYPLGHLTGTDDPALLTGISGIGWFYLQVACGKRRDPLLLPALDAAPVRAAALAHNVAAVEQRIQRNAFPRLISWQLAERASLALLAMRERIHNEQTDVIAASSALRISPDAAIIEVGGARLLVRATIEGASETPLVPLADAVLSSFAIPCAADDAIERLAACVAPAHANELRAVARAQIEDAVRASILVPA